MVRVKQAVPQARLGPVETRTSFTRPWESTPGWHPLTYGSGEEDTPEPSPTPKRRKRGASEEDDVNCKVVDVPAWQDDVWVVGSTPLETDPGRPLPVEHMEAATGQLSMQLVVPDICLPNPPMTVLWTDASGTCVAAAALTLPQEAVHALLRLIPQGLLLVRGASSRDLRSPGTASHSPGNASHSPDNASHLPETSDMQQNGCSSCSAGREESRQYDHLLFAFPVAAFANEPEEPDERGGSKEVKALLEWLRPEHMADRHIPHGFELPPSPPNSPTSPGGTRRRQSLSFDAAEVYRAVKPTGGEAQLEREFSELRPTLRPYQRRAAAWMLARETGTVPVQGNMHMLWEEVCTSNGRVFYVNPYTGRLSRKRYDPAPQVRGGILADEMGLGKTVELLACILSNPFPGDRDPPQLKEEYEGQAAGIVRKERTDCVCGATFEDEEYEGIWVQCQTCLSWMHGACVDINKRNAQAPFTCGRCWAAMASQQVTTDCGATLIVCPSPIMQQWLDEIAKHSHPGALRVMDYGGQTAVSGVAAHSTPVVTARDLAACDIVVTTYEVLQHDLDRLNMCDRGAYLRRPKRYKVIPSPLASLKWWRVCLDEAQMVGNSTRAAAEMAQRLEAHHRWAVTGTPLNRGLGDLYGLLAFLRVEPMQDSLWWNNVCVRPYDDKVPAGRARVLGLLRPAQGGLMWRTSKADVTHEIGIPPQHHRLTSVHLSAIERHFYNSKHRECGAIARAALSGGLQDAIAAAAADSEAATRYLDHREESRGMAPLMRLRQACCHPQVGGGGVKALQAGKAPMTMAEILVSLANKARVEAEDAQRLLLSALNGLAAVMLLQANTPGAIQSYRQVLATAESNKALIRADPLQRLHTLHNLAELLQAAGPGLPRTLRDDQLRAEARVLEQEYMAQWVAKAAVQEKEYRHALEQMDRAASVAPESAKTGSGAAKSGSSGRGKGRAAAAESAWYMDAIDLLVAHGADEGQQAADYIKDQLSSADLYRYKSSQNATSLARRFTRLPGLKMLLLQELEAQDKAGAAVMDEMESLMRECGELRPELVEEAGACGRCRAELGQRGRVCRHCRLDDLSLAWELRLFCLTTRALGGPDTIVSAEAALLKAQEATLQRVGRGRVNEEAADGKLAGPSGLRADAGVSGTDIVRHPSEAEQVLRLLLQQLRGLKSRGPLHPFEPSAVARRDGIAAEGKRAVEQLEAARKVHLRSRGLALAQRALLYARDELGMATMRLRLRLPGEVVKPHEVHFKLHEAELPPKNMELTMDRIKAEGDLTRTLGTLRYLTQLQEGERKKAAHASVPPQATAGDVQGAITSEETEACPVCQESLTTDMVMLPCAHRLCARCCMITIEHSSGRRAPQDTHLMQGRQGLRCPTCRLPVLSSEVIFVDNGRTAAQEQGAHHAQLNHEMALPVEGSYSTKLEAVVRRIMSITRADETAKLLVFSNWHELLSVLAHALRTNNVPFLFPSSKRDFERDLRTFQKLDAVGPQFVKGSVVGVGPVPVPPCKHVPQQTVPPRVNPGRSAASEPAPPHMPTCNSLDDEDLLGDHPANHHHQAKHDHPAKQGPSVLLLTLAQGGNGLNLTEAQHVILLEPQLSPAVEAQAIGRVDRIGQKRDTWVHRFVVEASIEENVHRLCSERAAAMDLSAPVTTTHANDQRLTVREVALLLNSASWTKNVESPGPITGVAAEDYE